MRNKKRGDLYEAGSKVPAACSCSLSAVWVRVLRVFDPAPKLSAKDREWMDNISDDTVFYQRVPYYSVEERILDTEEFERYRKALYRSGDFLVSAYKDGICINRYLASARDVEIPEKIDGKQVIKIGSYPKWSDYYQNYTFGSVFEDRSIKTVLIPSSVKEIAAGSFENVMDAVTVHEDNAYYASQDGMLYNKTKDYLLFVPENAADSTFAVPENVVRITDDVLTCEAIDTLVLHEKIEQIHSDYARDIASSNHLQCFEVDANNP